MNELKILILLSYFERPNMVTNAINSVISQGYTNWEVAAIDDGSVSTIAEVITSIVPDGLQNKFKVYNTNDTIEEKNKRGGAVFGRQLNDAISESDADIAIVLCDDDALYPNYLSNLNIYFTANKDTQYCYSHVVVFDPTKQKPTTAIGKTNWHLNRTNDINPFCKVDASQVAWRTSCNKAGDIWFPFPQTSALDATFFQGLFNKYGFCQYTGFVGEYKAVFSDQLGNRVPERVYKPEDVTIN